MLPDKRNPENVPDPYGLRRQSPAATALWIRVSVSERKPKRGRCFVLCRIPKHKVLVLLSGKSLQATTSKKRSTKTTRFMRFGSEPLDWTPDGNYNRAECLGLTPRTKRFLMKLGLGRREPPQPAATTARSSLTQPRARTPVAPRNGSSSPRPSATPRDIQQPARRWPLHW